MIFPMVIQINILVSFLWQLVVNLSVQGVGTILTVIWDHYKWNNDGLDWDSNLGPLNLYIMSMLYQLSYLATLNEPAWSIHMHIYIYIYMLMFIINLKIVSQWGWQKLHVHKKHLHTKKNKQRNANDWISRKWMALIMLHCPLYGTIDRLPIHSNLYNLILFLYSYFQRSPTQYRLNIKFFSIHNYKRVSSL